MMKLLSELYRNIRTNNTVFRSACVVLVTMFILLVPLTAMQFTDEVSWGLADFAVAGFLFLGTGFTYVLATRRAGNISHRSAVGVALVAAFLLVWINLAVGIIGTEGNAANLMYIGVLAVGIIGAIIVRFKSQGMVYAMIATAIAQTLVVLIVLIAGLGSPINRVSETSIANGFFIALWVGSAWLFKRGSSERATT